MSDAEAHNLCVWVRIRQPPDGTLWPQTAGWHHVGPSLLSQISWEKPPASPLLPNSSLQRKEIKEEKISTSNTRKGSFKI